MVASPEQPQYYQQQPMQQPMYQSQQYAPSNQPTYVNRSLSTSALNPQASVIGGQGNMMPTSVSMQQFPMNQAVGGGPPSSNSYYNSSPQSMQSSQ
jgi:hypothetical protein